VARKGAGRSAAVQLIVGEDSYLAEQALERVLQLAVGQDRTEAVSLFYGDESRWEGVLAAARTGSLFATRRAIVVRRADLLRSETARAEEDESAKGTKTRSQGDHDPVVQFLEDPPPEVTLVLLAAKPDRRRNPWKRLCTEGLVHSAEPKKGSALRSYVEEHLRQRGLRLTPDAVADLILEVGQDLRRLIGELDKLEAWGAGRQEALTGDDVHAVLGRGLGRPLYLLADSAAGRDLPASLQQLEELLEGGEEGIKILYALHRSLRQVRAAAALRAARVPRAEIGPRLLPPNMQFKLDRLLEASRRWSEADLRRAFAALERADRRMKSGADAATTLVATLVASCRGELATSSRRGR
jgi:DNA polymerase III delta subunit